VVGLFVSQCIEHGGRGSAPEAFVSVVLAESETMCFTKLLRLGKRREG